jgi:single-strand DNA-binding protein
MLKLQIIGNLGKDAEIRQANGKTVIGFNVAHTEKYKDAQGVLQSKTTWVACSYWTERTAVVPYLKKGTSVFVEGTPSVDTYQNQQNETVANLRLMVREIQLIGGQRQEGDNAAQMQSAEGSTNANSQGPVIVDSNDALPF